MAEFLLVAGTAANFCQLVDATVTFISFVRDCVEQAGDVPGNLQSLFERLPLLEQILQDIRVRAQARQITDDKVKALIVRLEALCKQIDFIKGCLDHLNLATCMTRFDRMRIVFKSMKDDRKLKKAIDRFDKSINDLILHQMTNLVNNSDYIPHISQQVDLLVSQMSTAQYGSVASTGRNTFGMCLSRAPVIEPSAFVGRRAELQQLHEWLSPQNSAQRVVCIAAMGGMGKTQLSLAYAQEHNCEYSSIFWVNAQDATSLRRGMASIHKIIFSNAANATASPDEESRQIERVRAWLSEEWNTQWLMIFDNYDHPDLSEKHSSNGHDIRLVFPHRTQGSILITTRSFKLTLWKSLNLERIVDVDVSIAILSQRSRQDLTKDQDAKRLAMRLAGLPLALATAGTYVGQTGTSCAKYYEDYDRTWSDLHEAFADGLIEYGDRNLNSTWIISFDQVCREDADAAELFKFLAYFSYEDIWYELIQAGAQDDLSWLGRVAANDIKYHNAMSKLRSYGLIETTQCASHQVHPCVHDWIFEHFHSTPCTMTFLAALSCISKSYPDEVDPERWKKSRRLLPHILRLQQQRFHALWKSNAVNEIVLEAHLCFGRVFNDWASLDMAEQELTQVWTMATQVADELRPLIIKADIELGRVYHRQGRFMEACHQLEVAATDYKDLLAQDAYIRNIFDSFHAAVEQDMDEFDEAEDKLTDKLSSFERTLGSQHPQTLSTLSALGQLYHKACLLSQAEETLQLVYVGFGKTLGSSHMHSLGTLTLLAEVHHDLGHHDEAMAAYQHVLTAYQQTLGREHLSTLNVLVGLGAVYVDQGRVGDAERMLVEALRTFQRTHSLAHISRLTAMQELGYLYTRSCRKMQATKLLRLTIFALERVLCRGHTKIIANADHLACLYDELGRLNEAAEVFERMYSQSCSGTAVFLARPSISVYARVLSNIIAEEHEDPEAVNFAMARLIHHIAEWHPLDTSDQNVFYWLGHSCRYIFDEENAGIAFGHYLKRHLQDADFLVCKACGEGIDVAQAYYVCLVCGDFGFCDACILFRCENNSKPHSSLCDSFVFHDVRSIVDWLLSSPEAEYKLARDAWIEALKQQYPPVMGAEEQFIVRGTWSLEECTVEMMNLVTMISEDLFPIRLTETHDSIHEFFPRVENSSYKDHAAARSYRGRPLQGQNLRRPTHCPVQAYQPSTSGNLYCDPR